MAAGLDRRRHIVYFTRHTEYHCRGRECVGVRDRETGRWQRWHGILRSRLVGSVLEEPLVSRRLELGARLVFIGDGTYMTSQLVHAARPPKSVIWSYASLISAGAISA